MQIFLDRTHCVHEGRASSHFILRSLDRERKALVGPTLELEKTATGWDTCTHLQLLQPVFTLGLLVRALLGFPSALVAGVLDVGAGPEGVFAS